MPHIRPFRRISSQRVLHAVQVIGTEQPPTDPWEFPSAPTRKEEEPLDRDHRCLHPSAKRRRGISERFPTSQGSRDRAYRQLQDRRFGCSRAHFRLWKMLRHLLESYSPSRRVSLPTARTSVGANQDRPILP